MRRTGPVSSSSDLDPWCAEAAEDGPRILAPGGPGMVQRAKVRFPASDIWDAPDDGKIYEVIDGALFVSPAPSWFHQKVVAALLGLIWPFVRQHGLGHVVPAPTG